ncbi:hypothetical protein BHE74_00043218 [Ensete ventricosum]|nr:hypothetical protein BHE74_00043218 [Ensete ventricosum]
MISSPIPTSLETLAPMAAAMENPLAVASNVKHFLRHKLCMSFAAHSKRSGKVRLPFAFPVSIKICNDPVFPQVDMLKFISLSGVIRCSASLTGV